MVDNNLFIRILSSVGIFLIFFTSLFFGGILFHLLISFLVMLSSFELFNMLKQKVILCILGAIVIVIPYSSLAYIYYLPRGNILLLWLFFSIWSVDSGAYFFGKYFGGAKIIPMISPNKTWSGLYGGILLSIVISVIFSVIFGIFLIFHSVVIGIFIALISQLGDFFESAIKRYCNVKDSGTIVPGHGGVLDRMDGFIFTAPIVAFYIEKFSKFFQ